MMRESFIDENGAGAADRQAEEETPAAATAVAETAEISNGAKKSLFAKSAWRHGAYPAAFTKSMKVIMAATRARVDEAHGDSARKEEHDAEDFRRLLLAIQVKDKEAMVDVIRMSPQAIQRTDEASFFCCGHTPSCLTCCLLRTLPFVWVLAVRQSPDALGVCADAQLLLRGRHGDDDEGVSGEQRLHERGR